MNESISYEKYQRLLEAFRNSKDAKIRAELKTRLKANANKYRIKRKEAMIEVIERERLINTDIQLTETKNHLARTYRSIADDNGFTGISRDHVTEVLRNKWSGSNYSERIWKNNQVVANKMRDELLQSIISGKSYKLIAQTLENQTSYGKYACNRLIRTETSYVVNMADLESSKKRGVKAKKFQATLDLRTSKLCRDHNQIIVPIEKIKIGVNCPPLHPFCRSFMTDLLEGWDYETDEELKALISDEYKDKKIGKISKKWYNINVSGATITDGYSEKAIKHKRYYSNVVLESTK